MGNFCGKWWNQSEFQMPNVQCHRNVNSELSIESISPLNGKLEAWNGEMLKSSSNPNDTALLLGSAVWDLLEPTRKDAVDPGFVKHIEACRQLVTKVQKEYPISP
jgi:hypothetical protein